VPEAVKEVRQARFMAVQAGISAARLAARVGTTLDVLVDAHADVGRGKAKRRIAIGRSLADAPEIDGLVRIEDGADLASGTLVKVTIEAADEHELAGRLASG
jgi:ribosomal protein S12 methylthiotransferase